MPVVSHLKPVAQGVVASHASAHAPLAQMFGYATGLRSLTQGRATYTMQPFAYFPAPESAVKPTAAAAQS